MLRIARESLSFVSVAGFVVMVCMAAQLMT